MIPTPIAFSPGSVTGFFVPTFRPIPAETTSRGLAFCLGHGVTAAVQPSFCHRVLLNGNPIDLACVVQVLVDLAPEPVTVHLESALPLGCGFGVSAAGALGTAFALNRRFDLGRSREDLAMIAHSAEVMHRTGIGDVAAQVRGGIVFRHCRTGPLDGLRLERDYTFPLYYRCFGALSTRAVLNSAMRVAAIVDAGNRAIAWLETHLKTATIPALLYRSRVFVEESGLLTHPGVRTAIREGSPAGGSATMVVLGEAVLATAPGVPAEEWTPCMIDPQGARVLP